MCVCVRARARAREARSDFWPPKVIFGKCESCWDLHRWWPLGIFWIFGKTCKILQACIHVLVKLIFRIREKHKFWIISNEYTMRRNWRDEKISTQKILTFQEWVIILRSIVATWTLNHTWFRIMTISYRKPKNLNRLRISLAPNKVLFLATSASGTWFNEINIFRCSLCFDLFTESLQCSGCRTLRPSMVYEVLRWHTKTTRMLCATLQNLSVPLRKSDYLPWDTGLTILAIYLKLLWNPNDNS